MRCCPTTTDGQPTLPVMIAATAHKQFLALYPYYCVSNRPYKQAAKTPSPLGCGAAWSIIRSHPRYSWQPSVPVAPGDLWDPEVWESSPGIHRTSVTAVFGCHTVNCTGFVWGVKALKADFAPEGYLRVNSQHGEPLLDPTLSWNSFSINILRECQLTWDTSRNRIIQWRISKRVYLLGSCSCCSSLSKIMLWSRGKSGQLFSSVHFPSMEGEGVFLLCHKYMHRKNVSSNTRIILEQK